MPSRSQFEQPPANPCVELKIEKLAECVDEATGDALEIAEGWSALINSENTTVAIFLCRNPLSCPAGTLDYSCTGFMSPCNCSTGYTGVLCGNCAPQYALKPDASCEECIAGSTTDFLVVICAFALLIFMVSIAMCDAAILICPFHRGHSIQIHPSNMELHVPRSIREHNSLTAAPVLLQASKVHIWYNYFTIVQDLIGAFSDLKDQLWPIAKIMIALMQILGGMTSQLNISFPQVFEDFVKKFIVS